MWKKHHLKCIRWLDKPRFTTIWGTMVWFFAWGNDENPPFIVQALINKYWPREWYDIYNKFVEALYDVKDIEINWWFSWDTAAFIIYEN